MESVTSLDVDRLSELLGSTPTAAQRFQREAHHLLARLGATGNGHAESALLEAEDAAAIESPASILPQPPPKAYDAALARWRELDALEDARSAAEPIVEESSAPSPHISPRTPLAVLQDLADESHDALIAAGIVDLEGLAACDALELSRATGLDYSNAVRWRSLARRALPAGTERFSRSEMPDPQHLPLVALDDYVIRPTLRAETPRAPAELRAEPREETAGGPFA